MPVKVHAPSSMRPVNVVLRLTIFFALAYAADRLADDVVLPGPWGVLLLIPSIAFLLMAPGLIANALCDAYDRLRDRGPAAEV